MVQPKNSTDNQEDAWRGFLRKVRLPHSILNYFLVEILHLAIIQTLRYWWIKLNKLKYKMGTNGGGWHEFFYNR